MATMPERQADHGCRCASSDPMVVDPAESPSVEMVPVGPGGAALTPVLVIPGGIRITVDAFSEDTDAALWWYDLSSAAASASLCYPPGSEPAR